MQADAVLHFGTHGSLEFMPGKQVGMSDLCYPDSLISTIPNIYYYAANNPSEATIAKRRSYANTISYLTPPAENAGLYKGLKVITMMCITHTPTLAAFGDKCFCWDAHRRGLLSAFLFTCILCMKSHMYTDIHV